MYDEIKTPEQYQCALHEKRTVYWKMMRELERKNLTDSPDYHRAISAWAAYDASIVLFEELMKHLYEKGSV